MRARAARAKKPKRLSIATARRLRACFRMPANLLILPPKQARRATMRAAAEVLRPQDIGEPRLHQCRSSQVRIVHHSATAQTYCPCVDGPCGAKGFFDVSARG
jgi:hypothetical protein